MVLRGYPVEAGVDSGIHISHTIQGCLPFLQEVLALLLAPFLEVNCSDLHLDVKDGFIDPQLPGLTELGDDPLEEGDSSVLVRVLARGYDGELGELEQVDLGLEIGDEIVVELYERVVGLQKKQAINAAVETG